MCTPIVKTAQVSCWCKTIPNSASMLEIMVSNLRYGSVVMRAHIHAGMIIDRRGGEVVKVATCAVAIVCCCTGWGSAIDVLLDACSGGHDCC